MPHLVLAFDPSTSICIYSQADGVDELPFPVAALLSSLRAYSEQSGWLLQDILLDHCIDVYHKGLTGILWIMASNNQPLEPQLTCNVLQVADAMAGILLGEDVCMAGRAILKRKFKGISSYIDQLFKQDLQQNCPLAALLRPHQTLLQPSVAAAQLPDMLKQVCAATKHPASSGAALLQDGWYCCATPNWQGMSSLQLLALQFIASAAVHTAHEPLQQQQQAQYGHITLHVPGFAGTSGPDGSALQLLWCSIQPNMQLCLLTSCSYPLEDFTQNTQQLRASHQLVVLPLALAPPLLSVVVAEAGGCWATCSRAPGCEQICPHVQLAISLSQQADGPVLAHTGGLTVAALPLNNNTSTAFALASGHLSFSKMQQLVDAAHGS